MKYLSAASFFIVGLINFIPLVGVLSNNALTRLYEVDVPSEDFSILLRHRAVLFGITGAFIMCAAFRSELRIMAAVIGLVSMLSYIFLAYSVGTSNASLMQIAKVDIVAVVILIIGISTHAR